MSPAGQTVCLSMIVKNEAPVIRRCLESVRPIIDRWVIVDTGSSDGTQDIIRAHLEDVPGILYEREWRDFAFNRSEALRLARSHGDYSLVIDADDVLEIPSGFQMKALTADAYTLFIRNGQLLYPRTQLVSNRLEWFYRGVLHEFITCDSPHSEDQLDLVMRSNHDGARRRNPDTYQGDAKILETALQNETDPLLHARYAFYLAQSYRDSEEKAKALEYYLYRAGLGGWQEEVFVSYYQAAKLKEALGYPDQEVLDLYDRATAASPLRVEARHAASRFCRTRRFHAQGYEIAKGGLGQRLPTGALFAEPWIYETGLLDEFAVNAYWAGHYHDCLDACLHIIDTEKLRGDDLRRITANARWAREAIQKESPAKQLGRLGEKSFLERHSLETPRPLRSRIDNPPRVLISILAKQKEAALPLYLKCIESLDYPKDRIVLYVRTNNNRDNTKNILESWVARVRSQYAGVEMDARDVTPAVEKYGVHEWNSTRFAVLAEIRNTSLKKTLEHNCDFYFVCDVDNFIRPCTLSELVALNLPIVAPFLRSADPRRFYSNFHAEIDDAGYYVDCDQYYWIANQWVRGIFQVPVVHCTYLIRADMISSLSYADHTERYEYVIFSETARNRDVPQYLDNRQVYGYVAFDREAEAGGENEFQAAARLLANEVRL